MKGAFAGVHLRTFCHATEDCDRVREALRTAGGSAEVRSSLKEGVHGNQIIVLEATVEGDEKTAELFGKLRDEDIGALLESLPRRMDEGCNFFFRLDKQEAFGGKLVLTQGEDVIHVRIKVKAFPARCEVAEKSTREFLESELQRRSPERTQDR